MTLVIRFCKALASALVIWTLYYTFSSTGLASIFSDLSFGALPLFHFIMSSMISLCSYFPENLAGDNRQVSGNAACFWNKSFSKFGHAWETKKKRILT